MTNIDDFSDAEPMRLVPLAPNAAALTIAPPDAKAEDLALSLLDPAKLDSFRRERDAFIKHYTGMVINSPEDLDEAGRAIDICIATKKQVGAALKNVKDYYFRAHRSFTGLEGDLSSPLDALEQAFRSGTVAYRLKVQEQERQARIKAQQEAAARAAAEKKEADDAARRAAAEAAESAAAAKAIADAAAEAGDLDAAMEAEAHAESANAQAEIAQQEAEAQEQAPVYVPPPVIAEPVLARGAGGSTLVDNWVAEPTDSIEKTVDAIIAACATMPHLKRLLTLDTDAVKKLVKALKGETVIPEMTVSNKPIDRRLGARGK